MDSAFAAPFLPAVWRLETAPAGDCPVLPCTASAGFCPATAALCWSA